MSTRYTWLLPEGCSAAGEVEVVKPLSNEPEVPVLRLRRGGSVNPILSKLALDRIIQLTGPPGCGKSTRVPLELQMTADLPVVHLVPHGMQAYQLRCDYSTTTGKRPAGLESIFEETGCELVIASYTELLSFAMRRNLRLTDANRSLIWYCDESHESDAATYFFIKFVKSRYCLHRSLLVSATLDGQEFAAEEAFMPVMRKLLNGELVNTSVQVLKGLKANNIKSRVLFFSDVREQRTKLSGLARDLGFSSFELGSKSVLDDFDAACRSNIAGSSNWFCAVDSSFRTGFNFKVNFVIDSGQVAFVSHIDGKKRLRDCFSFEAYQAKGRLGRDVESGEGVYFTFSKENSSVLAKIEGCEMPAAKIVSWRFGFDLPEINVVGLGKTRMTLVDYTLLNGRVPINLLPDDKFARAQQVKPDLGKAEEGRSGQEKVEKPWNMADAFAAINDLTVEVEISSDIGHMYCVPGDMSTVDRSRLFPSGKSAVISALRDGRMITLVGLMDVTDSNFVQKVFSSEMTTTSIKYLASMDFLKSVLKTGGIPNGVQREMLKKMERDLAIGASYYKKMAETLQLMAKSLAIDIVELDASEMSEVTDGLRLSLDNEYQRLSRPDYDKASLPTLQDVLPYKSIDSSKPCIEFEGNYGSYRNRSSVDKDKRITSSRTSTANSGSGVSSSSSWLSFGTKIFDGRVGKLVTREEYNRYPR